MAKQTVDIMVSGGKATAAPPLGPAMGPLGVNIGQVVAKINEKTKDFVGMQVPVKVTVDTETKEFEITIGTPPTSELLKKEIGFAKGPNDPKKDKVADTTVEALIKVSNMKQDALLGKTLKSRVKEIMGTCNAMGVTIDGKQASLAQKDVDAGVYDALLKE
ncbi:MAG: large subunit ribosomal protein L11 [Candidatus Woesearchaeota archaeon]|jgi:large subunit ribosomal protein L11